MKNNVLLAIFIFSCFSFANIHAEETTRLFALDIGNSNGNIDILRLGIQKEFNSWPVKKGINIPGYFESSLLYLQGSTNDIYGIAFSPVFVFQLCDNCKYKPYFEFGIGISFLSI